MPLPRVLRTATFRLAVVYAALFSASALVLAATLYWAMTGFATDQMRAQIEAEVATLNEEASAGGNAQLALTIGERLAGPAGQSQRYLLLDASGQWLAGNLPAMPLAPGWRALHPPPAGHHDDDDATILGLALPLPAGGFLFVGQDTEPLLELRELIIRAFAWAGGVTVALALLGAVVLSQSFLRRIEAINRSIGRIVEGDLNERVPTRGAEDELDRLAGSINRMLDRIQDLMEGLKQVSSDIAHDMRTPLARLRQGLEHARHKALTVAGYEDAVDRALAETDGILRTFGAVLRIAQIGAGTRRAGFATVDLSAVFETVVEAYAPVAEDRAQTLSGQIAPGVRVRGDRELLTQMLANLVENAMGHTPAGTQIDVALHTAGERAAGVVADSGPGIPAGERDKVFRRFYRLDASRTTAGSGLGLSLVAAVADLHGIGITLADNAPGLRVVLSFPPGAAA